jgi:predicted 2-oxoglutarate/Fe(II)-dependent dioxygenase YbiX
MDKNLENYLLVAKKAIPQKLCKETIDKLNAIQWTKHTFYNNQTEAIDQNDNEPLINIKFIDSELTNFVNDLVYSYLKKLNFSWFKGCKKYTQLKFIKYDESSQMRLHCDNIHSIFARDEHKGVPILSVICLLNDDYEGGELVFFEDKILTPSQGDVIIFPSNFLFPHEVKPITKGIRYSVVSWSY